jgi:hypothetical protein
MAKKELDKADPVHIQNHKHLIEYAAWMQSYLGTSGYKQMEAFVEQFVEDVKQFGYKQTQKPKLPNPNMLCSKGDYTIYTYSDNPVATIRHRYPGRSTH